MKRILSATIFLIVSLASVKAQETEKVISGGFRRGGTRAQIKAMQTQKLKDSLGLTEDQAKNVDAIQQNYMLKMRAVKMDTQISEEERKTKLRQLQAERKAELKAVISEQQLAKMDNERPKIKKAKPSKKAYGASQHKKKSKGRKKRRS